MANLLILESVTEEAMLQYDPQGYAELRWFIGSRINVGDKYTYLAYREAANDFFSMPVGKKRNFCKEIDRYIAENKCEIDQIDSQIAGDDHIIW